MIKSISAAIIACLAGPAFAGQGDKKPIETACVERQLADKTGCMCLQTLGNNTVREGLHDLIAEYLGRQVDVAAIAAERGHSGAEQLASETYLFRRNAVEHCSIALPEN
ncbi:MAG: hypothetical protein ACPGSI_12535 [Pikeienuella sp.]